MLVVEDVSQGYGKGNVLQSLDLVLGGGVTALIGPNGAGKTTLLRTLATVAPPRAGRLYVAGVLVEGEAEARQARRRIGYLPQSFAADPRMRLRDFVMYGAWLRGIPAKERAAAAEVALAYVGLTSQARRRMGVLSGGTRQRAGIAWAIVGAPDIVLLDEPTVGLDPEQRLAFREMVAGLGERTVVLSTHLTEDVDAVCDQVMVMNAGRMLYHGATDGLRGLAGPGAPGHTAIERGYMTLLSRAGQAA